MKWLDQFRLTQTEKRGFLVLVVLINLVLIYFLWLRFWPRSPDEFESTLIEEVEVWQNEQKALMRVPNRFDPNTVDSISIYAFRLPNHVKSNWLKFRRYNRFNSKEDVLALYGMDSMWYQVNKDSIFIAANAEPEEDTKKRTFQKFEFDPNTVTKSQMEDLGFPEWLAGRIVKYRESGGRFYSAEDLLKIYNFPEGLYSELEPYINIKEVEVDQPKEELALTVDINQADSTDLITVPGIGPVFAKRIIEYRIQLGGFVSKSQLTEVYGIDEEKLKAIENYLDVSGEVVRLNVNSDEFKKLLAHPYLNFDQVKSIVNYRETIGPFKKVEDLQNLEGFELNDVKRLQPYLSVE